MDEVEGVDEDEEQIAESRAVQPDVLRPRLWPLHLALRLQLQRQLRETRPFQQPEHSGCGPFSPRLVC